MPGEADARERRDAAARSWSRCRRCVPLSVNATVSPGTPLPPEVSVAESVVVPPNVPVAGAAARLVALVAAVSVKQTCTLESDGVTAPFVVVRIALYLR